MRLAATPGMEQMGRMGKMRQDSVWREVVMAELAEVEVVPQ